MRILQVIEASLGGTRRYVEDIFNACDGTRHDNGIVYASARADEAFMLLLERMRSSGWQIFHLDLRREVDLRKDLPHAWQLRKIFDRFKPDIVHAHSSKAGAIVRLANIGRRPRANIVYTPNAVAVHLGFKYVLIERALSTQLDILAAVTESERREIRSLGIVHDRKIRVVAPTIRADYFEPRSKRDARDTLGYGDEPRIVTVGRLAPQKDPLGFLEIVRHLQREIADIRATWVGDGELRAAMDARIKELALTDVVSITGWTTDVRPYLAASDVFVSSSAYESFGYVTAEALAMSRPVIASRINGTIDIVTLDTQQCLYELKDYGRAATATAELLRDAMLANDIAHRGRERVLAAFSPSTTRRELFLAYEDAMCAK